MKNKKTIFHPIKFVGALVFLMAFTLNIQTSLNGEWELVNVGFAQGTSSGHTCPEGETPVVRTVNNYDLVISDVFNNYTKVDSQDCIVKECHYFTQNGSCSFNECVPEGGSSGI